jgi:peptide/nickel transport system permease protein
MLILLILVAGSGGSAAVMIVAMAMLLGLRLTPDIVRQFEEGERRSDKTSGIVLGLTRTEIVRNRVVPLVARRLAGAFAVHIPVIVLAEMSLSFLGYSGGRLSCGNLVAYGREVIVEAPWVAVCPGLLATAVVLVLALLGWVSSRALGTELGTRPF